MVTIPTPANRGAPVGSVETTPANTPFMNVRPADRSAITDDMQRAGQVLQQTGQELSRRANDAALRQAEVDYMEFEREILDPQTGIFTRRQGDAVGVTAEVEQRFNEFRGKAMANSDRLSGSGRQALEQYLQGAEQRMWKRAASHELQETTAYEETLIGAQIEGQIDRAALLYSDPAEVAAAAFQIESLAGDLADSRGLKGEARIQFIEAQTSAMHAQVANQMAATGNAVGAQAYLEEQLSSGNMDATDARALLAKVRPLAVEQQGKELAGVAMGGIGYSAPGTHPTDPIKGSPPDQFIARLIGRESGGRADVVDGADDGKLHIGLGQFGEARFQDLKNAGVVPRNMTLREFGTEANRELQMQALRWHLADIDRVIDAEGFLDKGWSRDGLRAVAHLGGIGGMRQFVMSGGNYDPADGLGTRLSDYYAQFSGSTAKGRADGVARIEEHPDPEVRAAAFAEVERQQALQAKQFNRRQGQLTDHIYALMEQGFQENGTFDLDAALAQPGVLDQLGDRVPAIRAYWEKRSKGEDIVTAPEVYRELQVMSETNPGQFAGIDLMEHRHQLSDKDWRKFTDAQARVLGEAQEGSTIKLSDLRSNIGPIMTGMKPEERGEMERRMFEFVDVFTAQNGKPPTAMQQYAQAERLASEDGTINTFNQPGAGNLTRFGEADLLTTLEKADELGMDSLLNTDLVLNVPMASGDTMEVEVSEDEIREVISRFARTTSRAPKPSQVIQMLLLSKGDLLP